MRPLLASLARATPILLCACGADTPHGDSVDTGPVFAGPPEVDLPQTGLTADQLAIVVNSDDARSAEIAAAYAAARGIDEARILSFPLGTSDTLSREDFEAARADLDAALGEEIDALLLAFTTPSQVDCMGTSAAFALGFSEDYCSTPCALTAKSPYFDSDSVTPYRDHGVRLAMMLSAPTLEEAEAYIQRGLDADDSHPGGDGWFIRTTDEARSVRYDKFEDTLALFQEGALALNYVDNSDGGGSDVLTGVEDVLFYLTGLPSVADIETNTYRPGALADHLTSYGGLLSDVNGQMPITEWLAAGATASFGTAHEPCNYTAKFPAPEILVPAYYRGATAIEAYWRSVARPGEGNFVGEPLARPWGHEWSWDDGLLLIETTHLPAGTTWALEVADSADGPWEVVSSGHGPGDGYGPTRIEAEGAWRARYRLSQE